jgi:hypothetical protein
MHRSVSAACRRTMLSYPGPAPAASPARAAPSVPASPTHGATSSGGDENSMAKDRDGGGGVRRDPSTARPGSRADGSIRRDTNGVPGALRSQHVTNRCISPRKLIKGSPNPIIAMSQGLESYYSKVDVRNPIITKRNV